MWHVLCLLDEAAPARRREHPGGALGAKHLKDRGQTLAAFHHEHHPQHILVHERLGAAA